MITPGKQLVTIWLGPPTCSLGRWVLVQVLHNVRFFSSVATDQKIQKKLITEYVNTFFRLVRLIY